MIVLQDVRDVLLRAYLKQDSRHEYFDEDMARSLDWVIPDMSVFYERLLALGGFVSDATVRSVHESTSEKLRAVTRSILRIDMSDQRDRVYRKWVEILTAACRLPTASEWDMRMYMSVLRDDPPFHLHFVLSTLRTSAPDMDVGRLAAHRLAVHTDASFLKYVSGDGWLAVANCAMEHHLFLVLERLPLVVPDARPLFLRSWREFPFFLSFGQFMDSALLCLHSLASSGRVRDWESYVALADFEFFGHPYSLMALLGLDGWAGRFRPLVRDWHGVMQSLVAHGNSGAIPGLLDIVARFVPRDVPFVVGVDAESARYCLIERAG